MDSPHPLDQQPLSSPRPTISSMSRHLDLGCSLQCGALNSCGDCQELGDINKEVESGEDIVQRAKTRRSALLSRVNIRRDLLTSKLPVEIVCYIFEEYVKMHEVKPRENNMNLDLGRPRYFTPIHRRGPLRLGTVCRKWRSIAWSHPRLWRTLVVAVSCPAHHLGPVMVSEWLKRTGEQQLNMQLVESAYAPDDLPRMKKNAALIVQTLNRVSSRWRSLDFNQCTVGVLSELDDTGCASPSVLEHLCIGHNFGEVDAHGLELFGKSKHKHKPTHLNLLCAIRSSHFNIEWTRLTHLYLEDMSRKQCSHVLACTAKSSPALCHLTLRLVDEDQDFDGEIYSFQHSALKTLVIHEEECDVETTRRLLSGLTLPALQIFKYAGDDMDNKFPAQEFVNLLTRSACSLETLELLKPRVDDDDLARMLRAAPSVRVLKLELPNNHHSDPEDFFNCLSQKDLKNHPAAPFLPNLARLDIAANPPSHWRSFIGMFADDPMIHTPDFGQTRPTRHTLQVTFKVYVDDTGGSEMELMSLSQLAVLWKTHQFYAVFQFVSDFLPSMDNVSFLLESYRIGTIGLPRPALEKYTKLEQYLTTMSSLAF
ncbi:hypothetical protein D9619_012355 [Psilocybe cf. subviscida]|uniref:F-box domain-containing protein n=1 Tax=Psilocybe cf. subviscida TaxID=2480587 RepID=A0A8H5ARL7_9AGAR|nr:hypothetical protein D9619_012355 [Psilocybe cf. subviscida]